MDQIFIDLRRELRMLQEQFDSDLVSIEDLKEKFIDCLEEIEFLQDKYKELEYELNEYYVPRKIDPENGELL